MKTLQLPSQETLILDRLREDSGQWVSLPELGMVSGSMSVATRVSSLNKKDGIKIENDTKRSMTESGRMVMNSFYRLVEDKENGGAGDQ